jgi:hypothetical protein
MSDEDFGEERANFQQIIATQQRRIERLVTPLTENGLNEVSLRVAHAIEDVFAQGCSGRTQRLAMIQIIIRETVREATQGEKKWDAWQPGVCLRKPDRPA